MFLNSKFNCTKIFYVAKKQKFYVVWKGAMPGIYNSWEKCQAQINGIAGPQYKSFDTLAEAEYAIKRPYHLFIKSSTPVVSAKHEPKSNIIVDSISVDAACSGNPGAMEYQGVITANKNQLFHVGPLADGTNNIGEFLGLVHALAFLKTKNNTTTTIYTDSKTAIAWVKNKKAKTTLDKTKRNEQIFILIERAEEWLKTNMHRNPILKWNTRSWGEIPADFGRK